jgi:uncharacterized BrkB/YihY/UPF0761 family membrane protein
MIYVKSLLAGLIALIVFPVCLLLMVMVGMVIYLLVYPAPGQGSIGWDPISLIRMNPMLWSVPVFIFVTGFIWQYRRLTESR